MQWKVFETGFTRHFGYDDCIRTYHAVAKRLLGYTLDSAFNEHSTSSQADLHTDHSHGVGYLVLLDSVAAAAGSRGSGIEFIRAGRESHVGGIGDDAAFSRS